jgi:site-specific DNA-methyltransferase (adenine-specific)
MPFDLVENPAFDYEHTRVGNALLIHGDSLSWLSRLPENSIDGFVTDPPYGVKEYEFEQIERMLTGGTGIWRLPPAFDGHERSPLPRFTALNAEEREILRRFFLDFGRAALRPAKPGAHMLLASNSFLSQLVFSALIEAGWEFRTEVIRLVQTLRGGDRPKLGEKDFPDVCSLPRGGYEPWGLFRKPMPEKMTVRECLATYGTGGLRRISNERPFCDVIPSERTPKRESDIADHPSLKPQSLMRQLVRAILPLGKGVIVDPFMGSGSTLAAAEAVGYRSIGVDRYRDYYEMAKRCVPLLASVRAPGPGAMGSKEQFGLSG